MVRKPYAFSKPRASSQESLMLQKSGVRGKSFSADRTKMGLDRRCRPSLMRVAESWPARFYLRLKRRPGFTAPLP
jgi:hypothetical protein